MASLPVPAGEHAALATGVVANRPATDADAWPVRLVAPRATATTLMRKNTVFEWRRRNLQTDVGRPMSVVARVSPMVFPSVPTSGRRTPWRHDPSVYDPCHVANSPSRGPTGHIASREWCRPGRTAEERSRHRRSRGGLNGTGFMPRARDHPDIPAICTGDIDTGSAQARRYRDSGHDADACCMERFERVRSSRSGVSLPRATTSSSGETGCSAAKPASFAQQSVAGLFETDLTTHQRLQGGPLSRGRQPGPCSYSGR